MQLFLKDGKISFPENRKKVVQFVYFHAPQKYCFFQVLSGDNNLFPNMGKQGDYCHVLRC